MERQFIEQAKGMYKKDYTQESMIYFLKDAGADAKHIPDILDNAWTEYIDERTAEYKIVNKIAFCIAIALTFVVLIVFLGILPGMEVIVGRVRPFSILGAVFACFCAFFVFVYRNKWKSPFVENYGKVKIQYAFLLMFFLPGIILFYIFSARFSMAQDAVLKNSQLEAVGRVVDGQLLGIRRIVGGAEVSYSSITVAFATQRGDSVIVTKEVPTNQFKDFYKGQELHLIYSKDNPRNINLLADDESIRNFRPTQQRPIGMSDLLRLVEVDPQQLSAVLNKLSYGWTFDAGKNVYVNEHFQNMVSINNRQLMFVGPQENRITFPDSLKAEGFKQVGKDDPDDLFQTGPKIFENKQLRVTLKVVLEHPGVDGNGHAIVFVAHK
ncbi:MAG: hypothetical protein JWQ66_1546 [Mucilaginibacter sp.]|nr:hypothetical protein [Mucilaginibacter sp.]